MAEDKLLDSPVVFLAERKGGRHQRQHRIVLEHPQTKIIDDQMVRTGGRAAVFGSSSPGGLALYKTKSSREVELLDAKCAEGPNHGIRIVNLTKLQGAVGESPAGMEQIQELSTLASGAALDKIAKAKKFDSFTSMLASLTRAGAQKMIDKLVKDAAALTEDGQQNAKNVERQRSLQKNSKVEQTTSVRP